MRSRYEQLIEYIINDETEKAKELFHSLVVEKSRDIYNDLVAEDFGEEDSMDQTDDMMHDIKADHEGMDGGDDADDADNDFGDDEDEDTGEKDSVEDRVMDLEDELESLKAQFEELMADEAGEPEHNDGMNDPDFGDSNMGDDDEVPEGMVREYVEKVKDFYKGDNGEGSTVGTGNSAKPNVNSKSIVAGKNDMGGSTKNIARGGTNEDPDGKQYKDPSNEYVKGKGNLPHAGKFENVPGGNAGKAFSNAKKPQSKEGKFATGGGPNVNKKDILP